MVETLTRIEVLNRIQDISGIEGSAFNNGFNLEELLEIILDENKDVPNVMDFMSNLVVKGLSPRENETFLLKLYSLTKEEIAEELCIKPLTVHTHNQRIYDKFRPIFGEESRISNQNLMSLALAYVASGQAYLPSPVEILQNEYFFNEIWDHRINQSDIDVIDLMSIKLKKEFTTGQKKVLLLKMYGLSNYEISEELFIEPVTVNTYIPRITKKSRFLFDEDRIMSVSILTSWALAHVASGQARLQYPTESLMDKNPFLEKVWNPKVEYLKI